MELRLYLNLRQRAAIGELCAPLWPFWTQPVTAGLDFLLDRDGWLFPGVGERRWS